MDDLSREDLLELLSKYEEMVRMRLADEANPGGDPRREMSALAVRFPGALREIDDTPLPDLRARRDALSLCVSSGAPPSPWMRASAAYHRLLRGALAAKRWLAGRRAVDADAERAFLAAVEGSPFADDARAWAKELAHVAAPPRGKLTLLVFERVAAQLRISPGEARELAVGPSRAERRRRA